MTHIIGLTGSIGMGKSTTSQMFADDGIPVWDADAAVHELYAPGGPAVTVVAGHFPDVIDGDAVSRHRLRDLIAKDPAVLDQLQSLVHPLVAQHRQAFLDQHQRGLVLLDIPLLFETGGDALCDTIVVVSAPADIQKARVLARGEMSQADFDMILARQMPDAEKRRRADYVIETLTLDATRTAVQKLVQDLRTKYA